MLVTSETYALVPNSSPCDDFASIFLLQSCLVVPMLNHAGDNSTMVLVAVKLLGLYVFIKGVSEKNYYEQTTEK